MHEVGALLGDPGSPVSNPKGSWAILSFDVILDYVIDLTDPAEQRLIATSSSELSGNWCHETGVAPTQHLGKKLHALKRVEGFLYGSSKVDERCLVVFPDKLGPRSRIMFKNEMNKKIEKLK